MESNQEKFSYADYKTYQRVARILGEDAKQEPTGGKGTDNSDDQDPSVKYRAEQQKRYDQQQQKLASITKEQMVETDRLLDSIFLRC